MIRELWNRLRDRLRRDELDVELAEELQFHQQHLERDMTDPDMTDRSSAARRRLGNTTAIRESARERWSLGHLDVILQDVRFALRGLRKSPGFALGVIITLALGVGANAAMFGIIDRLMFRPLPYLADPASVNRVYLRYQDRGQVFTQSDGIEYTRYLDLRRDATTLAQIAAYTQQPTAVGTGQDVVERQVAPVSASFFTFFEMRPALGRFFVASEDSIPRGADVAVLGYDYWQSQFAGRSDILGQSIHVGNTYATIIGVAPRGFSGMSDSLPPAVYLPITTFAASQRGDADSYYNTYHWGWIEVIARRKPGVTAAQASADLSNAFRASWRAEIVQDKRFTPEEVAKPTALAAALKTGAGPEPDAQARSALWVSGVAVIVLLIACANVTNLFLVRAMRRRREIAVRLALGVSRWRLMVQHLTESVVLALCAGIGGMLVAQFGSAGIRHFFGFDSASLALLNDWRVLALTGIVATGIGIVTGVIPAMLSDRGDMSAALRSGARAGSQGRSRFSSALLVVQAALSVLLLIGAGLFVRSMDRVRTMHLGFDADPVILALVNARGAPLPDSQRTALSNRVVEAGLQVPGVADAAWVGAIPFMSRSSTNISVEGIDSTERLGRFTYQATTPGYFNTMSTRIVRGRGLLATDVTGAPRVVVVSDGMARVLWPGKDALGKCIKIGSGQDCFTVVGVAEDAFQSDFTSTKNYHYYVPITQFQRNSGWALLVRTRGDPARQLETVRRSLQQVMPGEYYVTTQLMRDVISAQRAPWAFGATMFTAFGILALVVAGIGLYALIGYGVAQRMHELGVRVALGAQRLDILRLIVSRGMMFAAAGTVIGGALALLGGRAIEPLLFRESSRDPLVFGGVAVLVLAVAVVATLVPALRAAAADPNQALRAE